MVKKIAIFAVLIPAILLCSYIPAIAAAPFEDIVASSALLAEADSGMLLFEHNIRTLHPADALTRVMTVLLAVNAIENDSVSADELIEMTETAWFDLDENTPTRNINPGEEMPLIDLLYCAYVGAASEACNMIAEHIDGSVDAFVRHMNDYAYELGCVSTRFTNTHGRFNENQYTTAQDMFFIFREAVGKELFAEIASVYRYSVEATEESPQRNFSSSNLLFNSNGKYFYRNCTAGMASSTNEGGYSFVAYAESEGLSLISVVLGSDSIVLEDESVDMRNLSETRRLFEWGFSEFSWRTILSTTDLAGKAPIVNGAGADFVNLRPETEIRLLLANDIPDKAFKPTVIIYSIVSGEALVAPIEAGTELGEITITRFDPVENKTIDYGTIKLVANTSIELHKLEFVRMQMMSIFSSSAARTVIVVLIIIVVAYLALVIRYNVIRRKRMRRIADAKRKLAQERQSSSNADD